MSETLSRNEAKAAIAWQMDFGVSETVDASPVNRLQNRESPRSRPRTAAAPLPRQPGVPSDPGRTAAECGTLEELHAAINAYEGSPLRPHARNTVVSDGDPSARVMIIGEAPGQEEDAMGRPFVGPSGRLLDEALSRIGLARDAKKSRNSFYITNMVYWRPPGNRNPTVAEIEELLPFTWRHIELAQPEVLLLLGNVACQNLLKATLGITRLRGQWKETPVGGASIRLPAMPSFHPSALLRTPRWKRLFWQDLLTLRKRLDETDAEDGP